MTEIHEGGCHCGAVRYRTTGAPTIARACACTWCQKRTGSAFGLSIYFPEEEVSFLQGDLRRYRLTADSGRWLETGFCETCGSTVTWTAEARPGLVGIAGGTFDQPTFWYDLEGFVYARSKPAWLVLPDGLPVEQTASYASAPAAGS